MGPCIIHPPELFHHRAFGNQMIQRIPLPVHLSPSHRNGINQTKQPPSVFQGEEEEPSATEAPDFSSTVFAFYLGEPALKAYEQEILSGPLGPYRSKRRVCVRKATTIRKREYCRGDT